MSPEAERELRGNELRFRALVEHGSDAMALLDARGTVVYIGPTTERLFGFSPRETLGRSAMEFIHPDDQPLIRNRLEDLTRQPGTTVAAEYRGLHKNGSWRWVEAIGRNLLAEPDLQAIVVNYHDITERKQAEAALRESEARYRALLETAADGIVVINAAGQIVLVNPEAERMFGYQAGELLGQPVEILVPDRVQEAHVAYRTAYFAAPQIRSLAGRRDLVGRKQDGREFPVEISLSPFQTAAGLLVTSIIRDVTERQQARTALEQAEEKYRGIFENAVEGIFQTTPEGRFLTANPALVRMLRYGSQEELIEQVQDIARQLYADPERRAEYQRLLEERGFLQDFECRFIRKDSSVIWVSLSARAVRAPGAGAIRFYEGTMQDITERRQLEEQFRQSQKMEAIGQLAGGVAHDFNNLLTIITGYTELLQTKLARDDPNHGPLREVQKAGERAASLTRQLLAFSRKQVLAPKVLDLNGIVADTEKMLRRLIGEDIHLVTVLDPALGHVQVDPGQMEQVILNLAVNARDAMPQGGKLHIETRNLSLRGTFVQAHPDIPPGSYVVLTIRDTGCGMDEATRARIFEPFFTTKGPGQGTGLGLATVYGIVKQSEGYIHVDTALGKGTTFTMLFPQASGPVTSGKTLSGLSKPQNGSETNGTAGVACLRRRGGRTPTRIRACKRCRWGRKAAAALGLEPSLTYNSRPSRPSLCQCSQVLGQGRSHAIVPISFDLVIVSATFRFAVCRRVARRNH